MNAYKQNKNLLYAIVFLSLLLSGCGARQLDKAINEGASRIEGEAIRSLVMGNTMNMEGFNYSARVEIFDDGTLRAVNSENDKESGRWYIDDDDRLCIKFHKWNHGDLTCHAVYGSGETYRLFTENGIQSGSFMVAEGTAPPPQKKKSRDRDRRNEKTVRPPSPQPEQAAEPVQHESPTTAPAALPFPEKEEFASRDLQFFYRDTAKNCPGCTLDKVDLAGASLVRAKLAGAKLKAANLKGADLQQADLKGADLRGADLAGANLAGADLAGADLTGAILRGANFRRTNLKGALIDETATAETSGSIR